MKEERYKICTKRILWRNIDGEIVILDLETDNYYSLNEIGSLIWELIGKGNAISKICSVISGKYKVDKRTAEKDIRNLIVKLKKDKLIINR